MSSATLNGMVNPFSFPVEAFFEWGLTTAYGNSTAATLFPSGIVNRPFSETITGLFPNTTYHYRAVAQFYFGTVVGADESFTTQPGGDDEPQFTTYGDFPQNCGVDWVLGVNVLPEGLQTTGHLEWGPTIAYGNTTPDVDLGSGTDEIGLGSEGLIGSHALIPGTTYHWRAHLFGPWGSKDSPDQTFTTPPATCVLCGCNPVVSFSDPTFGGVEDFTYDIDTQSCGGSVGSAMEVGNPYSSGIHVITLVVGYGTYCCSKIFRITGFAGDRTDGGIPELFASVTATRDGVPFDPGGWLVDETVEPGVTHTYVVTVTIPPGWAGSPTGATLLNAIPLDQNTCNGCIPGGSSQLC